MGILVALLAWLGCYHVGGALAAPRNEPPARGHWRLVADRTPELGPSSVCLAISGAGSVRSVRYSPNSLQVLEVRSGALAAPERARLECQFVQPAVRAAFQTRSFMGAGLSRGDQFRLDLRGLAGGNGVCFGFVPNAPDAIRRLLQDLQDQEKRLTAAPRAAAYMRAQPIEAARLETMRRGGKIRLLRDADLAVAVQQATVRSTQAPWDFTPIETGVYTSALTYCTQGHEYVYLGASGAHQVVLYRAATTGPGNSARAGEKK